MLPVLFSLFALLSFSLSSFSQSGCTDSYACNYDSGAVTDDGSCTYNGWYIPVEIFSGPAIQACEAPAGYVVPDQTCKIMLDGTVLLADDEEGIRDLLADILEELGLSVISVANGSLAYDLYCKNPEKFDLIVSDMQMPEVDGPSLLRLVRERVDLKQPRFIFITGGVNINFEDKDNELNEMIDGYFLKPFDESKIAEILKYCLERQDRGKVA